MNLSQQFRLLRLDPWYVLRGYPKKDTRPTRHLGRATAYLVDVGAIDLGGHKEGEFRPNFVDLAFLHQAVVRQNPKCILEFGCGFSTIVMAHALAPGAHLYSVDTSEHYIQSTRDRLGRLNVDLSDRVTISHSTVSIGTHNGQLCHFYDRLPDVVPDFVYLDGPDPADVTGDINGLSFKNPLRTVLSGDMLRMESTLTPGFFMVVDGRTNNVRFLQRNFQRRYRVRWDRARDITTFEMCEKKLGRKNIFGWENDRPRKFVKLATKMEEIYKVEDRGDSLWKNL